VDKPEAGVDPLEELVASRKHAGAITSPGNSCWKQGMRDETGIERIASTTPIRVLVARNHRGPSPEQGVLGWHEVIFAGDEELLTIRQETFGRKSYVPAVARAIREVMRPDLLGLLRGFDSAIGLNT
jgi:dihydrodipicolinate reductase